MDTMWWVFERITSWSTSSLQNWQFNSRSLHIAERTYKEEGVFHSPERPRDGSSDFKISIGGRKKVLIYFSSLSRVKIPSFVHTIRSEGTLLNFVMSSHLSIEILLYFSALPTAANLVLFGTKHMEYIFVFKTKATLWIWGVFFGNNSSSFQPFFNEDVMMLIVSWISR